jgi:hypothetical protein
MTPTRRQQDLARAFLAPAYTLLKARQWLKQTES